MVHLQSMKMDALSVFRDDLSYYSAMYRQSNIG